jgi:Domain of unknown function (DUF389)
MARAGQAGIVHLRLVVPTEEAERVLGALMAAPAVVNVVRIPGSAVKPAGDLILCDVAREDVSVIVEQLRQLGLERDGSISIETVESSLSAGATRAAGAAAGAPADAVIWEEVEARTSESADLSLSFLAFVLILRAAGPAPDEIVVHTRPATFFIAHPNTFSVLVALLAGVAGVLSLTAAKSGALVGVLISVTTIPAAANIGVAAAYQDWEGWRGSMAQLAVNMTAIVLAGTTVLYLQRLLYLRRRRRHVAEDGIAPTPAAAAREGRRTEVAP